MRPVMHLLRALGGSDIQITIAMNGESYTIHCDEVFG